MIQILVSINRDSGVPIQDQLMDGIHLLITQGAIKAGLRLPATRVLSRQLNISRNTVKNAYSNLISQGFLQSNGTSGTFVCSIIPDVAVKPSLQKAPLDIVGEESVRYRESQNFQNLNSVTAQNNIYDFNLRNSDPSIAPDRAWRRLLLKHLPYRSRYANSVGPLGLNLLREAIAEYVCPLRGMSIIPDNSIIVSNDYRAFDIVSKMMLSTDSCVAVEDPCDAGIVFLLNSSRVKLLPIPIDNEGIIVSQLPAEGVDFVYVSPSHQQPTGVTMSMSRRHELVKWASDTGAHILEWDTYGDFCYDESPLPSIYSLDTSDRVIYLKSFANWAGASLKLGYIVVPPGITERILSVKEFVDPITSWLDQRVVADFISSNSFFGHLRLVRQALKRRRDATITAIIKNFGPQIISGQKTGGHLVWTLPNEFQTSRELQNIAATNDILIPTLYDGFCWMDQSTHHHDPNRTVLLGYSGLSEEIITEGVEHLANVSGKRNHLSFAKGVA